MYLAFVYIVLLLLSPFAGGIACGQGIDHLIPETGSVFSRQRRLDRSIQVRNELRMDDDAPLFEFVFGGGELDKPWLLAITDLGASKGRLVLEFRVAGEAGAEPKSTKVELDEKIGMSICDKWVKLILDAHIPKSSESVLHGNIWVQGCTEEEGYINAVAPHLVTPGGHLSALIELMVLGTFWLKEPIRNQQAEKRFLDAVAALPEDKRKGRAKMREILKVPPPPVKK